MVRPRCNLSCRRATPRDTGTIDLIVTMQPIVLDGCLSARTVTELSDWQLRRPLWQLEYMEALPVATPDDALG